MGEDERQRGSFELAPRGRRCSNERQREIYLCGPVFRDHRDTHTYLRSRENPRPEAKRFNIYGYTRARKYAIRVSVNLPHSLFFG